MSQYLEHQPHTAPRFSEKIPPTYKLAGSPPWMLPSDTSLGQSENGVSSPKTWLDNFEPLVSLNGPSLYR